MPDLRTDSASRPATPPPALAIAPTTPPPAATPADAASAAYRGRPDRQEGARQPRSRSPSMAAPADPQAAAEAKPTRPPPVEIEGFDLPARQRCADLNAAAKAWPQRHPGESFGRVEALSLLKALPDPPRTDREKNELTLVLADPDNAHAIAIQFSTVLADVLSGRTAGDFGRFSSSAANGAGAMPTREQSDELDDYRSREFLRGFTTESPSGRDPDPLGLVATTVERRPTPEPGQHVPLTVYAPGPDQRGRLGSARGDRQRTTTLGSLPVDVRERIARNALVVQLENLTSLPTAPGDTQRALAAIAQLGRSTPPAPLRQFIDSELQLGDRPTVAIGLMRRLAELPPAAFDVFLRAYGQQAPTEAEARALQQIFRSAVDAQVGTENQGRMFGLAMAQLLRLSRAPSR